MSTWTVIGLWDGDTPVPCGVIEGNTPVHGQAEYASTYYNGAWAESVEADTADEAEAEAVQVMLDTLTDDDEPAACLSDGCAGEPGSTGYCVACDEDARLIRKANDDTPEVWL